MNAIHFGGNDILAVIFMIMVFALVILSGIFLPKIIV